MNTILKPPTLWQDLQALPTQYWILFSGTLVNRFGHFVIPFLAIYLRQSGYDNSVAGIAMGAYGAGSLIAGVLGGYLSDKIGRKPTMLISCFGAAVFMVLLSHANRISTLLPITFLTGLLSSMYGPAAGALIADLVPPELRVRAFSCQRLAINLGFAAGMAIAGFMAKQSFMTLFYVDAATTLILGMTILFGLKPRKIHTTFKTGWAHAIHHMNRNTAFKYAAAASFLISIVFWQMSSSYGLQTTEGAKFDERVYGLLLALNGVLIVLIELPLTSITRRFRPITIMATGYTLIGVGMGLNAFGATLSLLITSMLIFTIGEMIALPVSASYLANLAPDEMRGRYQGAMSITYSSAVMFAPYLGLTLYQFSPVILWLTMLAISCLAAALMIRSAPQKRRSPLPSEASQPL
jgi:MFS family permease